MQCIGEMPVQKIVFGELQNPHPFRMWNVTGDGLDSCFMRGRVTLGGERREPARRAGFNRPSRRPPGTAVTGVTNGIMQPSDRCVKCSELRLDDGRRDA
jgi:hypothetical protein